MRLKPGRYWRKLRELGPRQAVRRARDKAEERLTAAWRRTRARLAPAYATVPPAWLSAGLQPLLRGPVPADARPDTEAVLRLAAAAAAHRFDLLGSGPVVVGPPPPGVQVSPPNRAESARLRALISTGYRPIDWHADFKSGHRWPADGWHADLNYGSTPGADIKVPWELSRMQHLAALAWASGEARAGKEGFSASEDYAREFRDQILDFLSACPPGFGAAWGCTMDVGIRIANWLFAWELFRAQGAVFDSLFEDAFARGTYEHARHIVRNLEWGPGLRGNHYLADIAGLCVAACHLPPAIESDAWLGFAVRELIAEARIQFLPDGANFEASTCYHRLSAEMLAYATAAFLALPDGRREAALAAPAAHRRHHPGFFAYRELPGYPWAGSSRQPFPPWYFERLERAAEFTLDITRPDGRVPQIGDNDSGRFLKLYPQPDPAGGSEDFLDHRHLVAAIDGFFGRADFAAYAGRAASETALVGGILGGRRFPSYRGHPLTGSNATALSPRAYPDFGLYVLRRGPAWLCFRCGPIGQLGSGGHAHNDQLSFELAVGGRVFLEDRGSYLYTADWDARNRFRSTAWHSTLAVAGREQDPWENTRPGLFMLINRSRAALLFLEPDRVAGRHAGFGTPHERTLSLGEGRLDGTDVCALPGREVRFHFRPGVSLTLRADGSGVDAESGGVRIAVRADPGPWSLAASETSPAYGEKAPAQVAVLAPAGESPVKWYIEWLP
ncbi:MAG: alginate lyase family protein [Fibrobacteres bacterium]|nr:alginate lyase family protein [Fibrobacterota bacterium]